MRFAAPNAGHTVVCSRYAILLLSLFCALAASQTASATTYNFTIPTGTQLNPDPNSIIGALSAAILNDGFGDTPSSFAFYDIYIRPQVTSDGCLVSTDGCGASDPHGKNMATVVAGNTFNLITDYSMVAGSVTAPVPGCISPITYPGFPNPCTSKYDATANVTEPVKGGAAAHFVFDSGDNAVALVTTNTNANNRSYAAGGNDPFPAGAVTEIMPSGANFNFTLKTSEYSGFQTPKITFEIYALAVQYQTSSATSLAAKNIAFYGDFDAVGSAPEPYTLFIAGGGLCLLGLVRRRRNAKP